MIRFSSPYLLFSFIFVLLLAFLFYLESRKKRARLQKLGDSHFYGDSLDKEKIKKFWMKKLPYLLALSFLCFSLAGPKWGSKTEIRPRKGIDLVFAVDVSNSMRARDVRPDRLERAKAEISMFADHMKEHRIGLVAFAAKSFVQCPLTTDVEAFRSFLKVLEPGIFPQGGTAVSAGLESAIGMFEREMKDGDDENQSLAGRVLVVISDGEDHEGKFEEASKKLAQMGVKTFLIGIGSGLGEPIPVLSKDGSVASYMKDRQGETVMTRMQPDILQKVATDVGGQFIDGTQDATLGMDQILAEINRLEKRDLKARVHKNYIDRAHYFILIAFLLFIYALFNHRFRQKKEKKMSSLTRKGSAHV